MYTKYKDWGQYISHLKWQILHVKILKAEFFTHWQAREYSKLWAIQDFAVILICAVYLW